MFIDVGILISYGSAPLINEDSHKCTINFCYDDYAMLQRYLVSTHFMVAKLIKTCFDKLQHANQLTVGLAKVH